VTRQFETDVGCCGLCPREKCNAEDGVCLVSVQEYIPLAGAASLSTHGRPWLAAPEDLAVDCPPPRRAPAPRAPAGRPIGEAG
jgi:hypothetical protein